MFIRSGNLTRIYRQKNFRFTAQLADLVADMEVDKVADKVADMEVDMVAAEVSDMEVDKVAEKVSDKKEKEKALLIGHLTVSKKSIYRLLLLNAAIFNINIENHLELRSNEANSM